MIFLYNFIFNWIQNGCSASTDFAWELSSSVIHEERFLFNCFASAVAGQFVDKKVSSKPEERVSQGMGTPACFKHHFQRETTF